MSNTSAAPRITVITATYNSSKTLKLALQSLLAQEFQAFEAWIVGDACTDDSEAVVASFGDARLQWTNLPKNVGSQFGPNNEGLRRARGEYIAYLGHDDLWLPWHLSGLLAHIETTGADLVHPLSAVFRPTGLYDVVGPPGEGKSYANHFVFPSSWLHRRDHILSLGGWRDARTIYQAVDMDLLSRITLAGCQIEFCPQLSVLKFPSQYWKIYAWQGTPPQADYLHKVLDSPREFEQACLFEIAVMAARQLSVRVPKMPLVERASRRIKNSLIRAYGAERTPLRQFLVWSYQRQRRAIRKQRGLA